jgi:hypothetical protein
MASGGPAMSLARTCLLLAGMEPDVFLTTLVFIHFGANFKACKELFSNFTVLEE